MSKSYQQLTGDERIEIYAMRQEGKTIAQMAEALGRHRTTISREIHRNSGQRNDRPSQAHRKAQERRTTQRKAVKMTEPTLAYIHKHLDRTCSLQNQRVCYGGDASHDASPQGFCHHHHLRQWP